MKRKKYISASEIGAFVYCPLSWDFQNQGFRNNNQEELSDGTEFHQQIGQKLTFISKLKRVAIVFFVCAIAILVLYFLANQR